MNISYKRAKVTCWISGILLLFLSVYFALVGPNSFLDNKIHFVVLSVAVFLSMVGYALYLMKTNREELIVDERDLVIQKKSFGISMMAILLYVFSFCMILFAIYRNSEVINVTWLWFLAYSTFAVSYFITSLTILYYYNKEN